MTEIRSCMKLSTSFRSDMANGTPSSRLTAIFWTKRVQYIPESFPKEGRPSLAEYQFITTKTELSEVWHWHRATVRSFLDKLFECGQLIREDHPRVSSVRWLRWVLLSQHMIYRCSSSTIWFRTRCPLGLVAMQTHLRQPRSVNKSSYRAWTSVCRLCQMNFTAPVSGWSGKCPFASSLRCLLLFIGMKKPSRFSESRNSWSSCSLGTYQANGMWCSLWSKTFLP